MIASVTETFEFACSDAKWWELVRSEDLEALDVLPDDDKAAFSAAREHVVASAVELLQTCFQHFQATIPNKSRFKHFERNRFQRRSAENEAWCRLTLIKVQAKFSELYLAIEEGWDGDPRMYLHAYACSSSEVMAGFQKTLGRRKNVGRRDEGRWYFASLPIEKSTNFQALADDVGKRTWPMLLEYHRHLSPVRGKAASA